jgi:hypothetical protein
VKKFQLLLLLLAVALAGCSKQVDPITLVIEYQKADSDACMACKNTGATDANIKQALDRLTRQLAAKGIRVELVEKKAVTDTSKPEIASGQVWMGDVPVETWLGASTDAKHCPACPTGPTGHGHLRKTLIIDGQVYDPIPVDLMVRAGMSAAKQLQEKQKTESKK